MDKLLSKEKSISRASLCIDRCIRLVILMSIAVVGRFILFFLYIKMNLKVFCNKCLKTDTNGLLVTSCRHVLCSECYAKGNRKCAVCQLPCKAIRFDQLPEEMLVYFKPIVPMLKKHLKIARFQLQQRSLWTDRKKFVLERMHRKKQIANEKKDKLVELRQGYKFAVHQNTDLKLQLK